MTLIIWIGGASPYNMDYLYNSNIDFKLVTMDTYAASYDNFVTYANEPLILMNDISKLGYGILNSYRMHYTIPEPDTMKIVKWAIIAKSFCLSIWASSIKPNWYHALRYYIAHSI